MKPVKRFSLLLFLLPAFSSFALDPDPSAREIAMGGPHPSLSDDFASAFSNPAAFASLEPAIRYAGFDTRISGAFQELLNVFTGDDPSDLYLLEDGRFVGLGFSGPFDAGYAGDGGAWRLRTWTSLDVFYPNLAVSSDFTFSLGTSFTGGWGTSFHLSDAITLDAGFAFRGFLEQRYLGEGDVVELSGILEELGELLEMPFAVVPGFGFDAGIIVRFGDSWTASMSVKDLLTFEFVSTYDSTSDLLAGVPPNESYLSIPIPEISVGGSWHPDLDGVEWFDISGIYLSFSHLLGGLEEYPVNYLLGIAAGTELVFRDFLSLRLGFSRGLPVGGLGFSFGGVDIDINCGAAELSNQPGALPILDLRLALAIGTR